MLAGQCHTWVAISTGLWGHSATPVRPPLFITFSLPVPGRSHPFPSLLLACPAGTLCLQNCLARLGLDEGITQGLVETEAGKVSLVLSLSKALVFELLLQARDQPAVALLRLQLNRLCKMALLTLCVCSLLTCLSPVRGHLQHTRTAGSAVDSSVWGREMLGVSC